MFVGGDAVEVLNGGSLDSIHDVVVEEKPKPVTPDQGYVMASVEKKDVIIIVEPAYIVSNKFLPMVEFNLTP